MLKKYLCMDIHTIYIYIQNRYYHYFIHSYPFIYTYTYIHTYICIHICFGGAYSSPDLVRLNSVFYVCVCASRSTCTVDRTSLRPTWSLPCWKVETKNVYIDLFLPALSNQLLWSPVSRQHPDVLPGDAGGGVQEALQPTGRGQGAEGQGQAGNAGWVIPSSSSTLWNKFKKTLQSSIRP